MAGIFDWFKPPAQPRAPAAPPQPGRATHAAVGEILGGEYTVREVFQGGMGTVYVVTHREHDEPLILKEPQLRDERSTALFVREASAWVSAGVHPNIVSALFVRAIHGRLMVAAEFVPADGNQRRSLRDWLASGPVSPELAVAWLAHAIYGLRHAARGGVAAHLDLKPENLLLQEGELRVTDFGLASLRAASTAGTPTTSPGLPPGATSNGGTPGYMAPEQIMASPQGDHRADIYALGVILTELIYGRRPFAAASVGELLVAHLSAAPSVPSGPFQPLILRCLSKDRLRRPQSLDDLLLELTRVAAGLSLEVPMEGVRPDAASEALFRQAKSWSAAGQSARALEAATRLVQMVPTRPGGWTELGRIHLDACRYQESRQATLRSLHLNPANSHAWNNLGIALRHLGDHQGAVEALERAMALDPLNTGAMLNIGHSLGVLGRFPEAISHLKNATTIAPRKATAWANLGAIQLQSGDDGAAEPSLRRALEIEPNLHEAATNLRKLMEDRRTGNQDPIALMRAGRWDAAAERLEATLMRHPEDVAAWHNLGLIALHREDRAAVFRCFGRVEALSPHDAFALKQLARAHASVGDSDQALGLCLRLQRIPDGRLDGATLRAQLLDGTGRHQEAVAVLRDFVASFPQADAAWFILGDIHARAGEFHEATQAFEQAERLLRSVGGGSPGNLAAVQDALRQCRRAGVGGRG